MFDSLYKKIINAYSSEYEAKDMFNIYIIILFVTVMFFWNFLCFVMYITHGIEELAKDNLILCISYAVCSYLGLYKNKIKLCEFILPLNVCFYVVSCTFIAGYPKSAHILFIPLIFAVNSFNILEKKYLKFNNIIIFISYFLVLFIRYNIQSEYEYSLYVVEIINIAFALGGLLFIIYTKIFASRFIQIYEQEQVSNLEKKVNTDFLTGLWNRRYMEILFEKEKTFKNSYIVMADIDYFKKVNDNYGHVAGDYILKEISSLLESHFRDSDYISRWGGEEFLLFIKDIEFESLASKLEDLRKKINSKKFIYEDNTIKISMTFGVSAIDNNFNIKKIIEEADIALYNGKNNGRNRIVYYEDNVV